MAITPVGSEEAQGRIRLWPWLVATTLLVCLMVLYSTEGLRGTDQYWYVADTERLSDGGDATTNNFFPGKLLREGNQPTPNYMMHNSPLMHFLAGLPDVLSAYHDWILFNLLSHLLVMFCIYRICIAYVDRNISAAVSMLYLVSPIAIWQVVNPLLEQYLAAITALVCLSFVYRERAVFTLLGLLVLALGAISHPIFVIPAYLFALLAIYENGRRRRFLICLLALAFVLLLGVFRSYAEGLMPTSFQPSLEKIITSAIPGGNNMLWHYSDTQPDLSVSLLISKFLAASQRHFLTVSVAPLFVFTNLAVVGFFFLVFKRFTQYRSTLLAALVLLGLYAGIVVLQQNHPRYQQIIAPVSFLMIALAWGELARRFRLPVVMAVITALLLVDGFMVSKARTESLYEVSQVASLSEQLDKLVPESARIVCIDIKPHNPFAYLARPRDVLFLRTKLLEDDKFEKALNSFSPDYVVSARTEENLGTLLTVIEDTMFGDLHLYQATAAE